MSSAAHFGVDPQLVSLLGRGYRSVEQALKELVDNAWDADAQNIRITIPEFMSADPIVVDDDGVGMIPLEVETEYLRVANNRRSRKGLLTYGLKRKVKGQKGIGKFAGFVLADVMTLETMTRGEATRVVMSKNIVLGTPDDLNRVDLPLTTEPSDPAAHGTRVTLSQLNPKFELPKVDLLKSILVQEYGREDSLIITVNGERLTLGDVPGKSFSSDEEVAEVGPMRLTFAISDKPHPARRAGICIRVGNKIVGTASQFGLENDPEIPRGMLNHVYGEVEVDGLGPGVTADGGGFTEGYIGHAAIQPLIAAKVKEALQEVKGREINLHKGRLTQEQERRLAKLPENRRRFAKEALERTMRKFYGESAERVETVTNVVLDAIERNEYFTVLQAIDDAPAYDVMALAEALEDFGLVDMAHLGTQAQSRLLLLDRFESLVTSSDTLEKQVHEVVEKNRWLLGFDYALIASNKTLKRVIDEYAGCKYGGERANKRPDLFLGKHLNGRHLLVEFKRPQHVITRADQRQAEEYRDDLTPKFGDIEILVLGKCGDPNASTLFNAPWLKVVGYEALISNAREQITWLLESVLNTTIDG